MREDIAKELIHAADHSDDPIPADGHIYNARGVIAENYHDLQGLGILSQTRDEHRLAKASSRSSLRAVYQAVEIGLLNLTDITARAASDIERERHGSSLVKMYWARGFHRVLTRLSTLPHQLGLPLPDADGGTPLRICESPAFQEYRVALNRLDCAIDRRVSSGALSLEQLLGNHSIDSSDVALLHVTRICNHESTIWEHNLSEVRVPSPAESYAEFVVANRMRDAVYDRVFEGSW